MSVTRDLTSMTWAVDTARRAAGDEVVPGPTVWTDEQWQAEISNHALRRGTVTYLNPYAAALVFVSSPRSVASRTEGSVSEQYTPPYIVVAQLKELSAALLAEVDILAPVGASVPPDLALNIGGW